MKFSWKAAANTFMLLTAGPMLWIMFNKLLAEIAFVYGEGMVALIQLLMVAVVSSLLAGCIWGFIDDSPPLKKKGGKRV